MVTILHYGNEAGENGMKKTREKKNEVQHE